MPILQTSFLCTNGHSFTANAKLRARCPTCGAMTKKDFSAKPEETIKSGEPITAPILLRQGKHMPARKAPAKVAPKKVTKPLDSRGTRARAVNRAAPAAPAKVSGGNVKHHSVSKGTTPKVTGKPPKTAPARHVDGSSSKSRSYLDDVVSRFGFGR